MTKHRWQQPGLCQCQTDDHIGHAHYPEGKHPCARCDCKEWRPSIKPLVDAIRAVRAAQQVLEEAGANLTAAWARLSNLTNTKPGSEGDNRHVMAVAEEKITNHTISEREKGYL